MEGVTALQDSEFTIGSDRIVTGTYLFGGVLTRGRILLSGAEAGSLGEVLHVIRKTGAVVKTAPEEIFLDAGEAFLAGWKSDNETLSRLSNGSSVGASFRHDGGTGEK